MTDELHSADEEMEYWRETPKDEPDTIPEPGPDEESVWDYPHQPVIQQATDRVTVIVDGTTVATSQDALRVVEKSQPPTYYIPADDTVTSVLHESTANTTLCEWKGRATYYDITTATTTIRAAAWSYHSPPHEYQRLADHYAFFPDRVDACYVGSQRVTPQNGDYYGGWITPDIVGPFKTEPRQETEPSHCRNTETEQKDKIGGNSTATR